MRPVALPVRVLEQATVGADGVIDIVIGAPLVNRNSGNRNPKWFVKARGRNEWAARIQNAIVGSVGFAFATAILSDRGGMIGARGGLSCQCEKGKGKRCQCPATHRRRVVIRRLVPSPRNYVRDSFDNLPACTKELRDALSWLGLIRDDSDKWCEMTITQGLTGDGTFRTEIHIEPALVGADSATH